MSLSKGPLPPLSPVLIAGLALRPMPLSFAQPALNKAMSRMARRHPGVFERMGEVGSPQFLIDPVDLPVLFLMDTDPDYPALKLIRHEDEVRAEATIRGPLTVLIDLLQGRIDGDALFFSRDLVIEGDTEAVLALRNSVDGADVDVFQDLLSLLGPAAKPAGRAALLAGKLFARLSADLDLVRDATLAPLHRQTENQARTIRELEETVAKLKRQTRRGKPAQ